MSSLIRFSLAVSVTLFFIFQGKISAQENVQKIVTLASTEYEPYIGKNLPNQGYLSELAKEAFSRAGYQVIIKFYPLARAIHLGTLGQVDGLIPLHVQDPLKKKFNFSHPFPGSDIGLLKKKSLKIDKWHVKLENPEKILQQLQNYKFGIVRGFDTIPSFQIEAFKKKHFVRKNLHNIDMLAADRIDFVVIDKYTAADLMVLKRPHLIGQLEFVSLLLENPFHMAFSKKSSRHKQLQKAFNQGLKEITEDGTLDQILAKHGLDRFLPIEKEKMRLTIGAVNNPEIIAMKQFSSMFEKIYPNIKLEWKLIGENTLRRRLMSDLAISEGQFDIIMIGTYETPIWGKNGWLVKIDDLPESYDLEDVIKPVRDALSYEGDLYALPFYAESCMTIYRKDLFKKAGITMPKHPTYKQIMRYAKTLHDPQKNIYGIGLRGKAGWGQNMGIISTMVNTFGGRWFDEHWNPTIDTPEWKNVLSYYKKILKKYGHPNRVENGWMENKKLFADGQLAMLIDATVIAGELCNPKLSKVHDKVGFAFAPTAVTTKGSHWLWSWALAIPASSKNTKQAFDFITWVTSKDYIKLISKRLGWLAVPPGTRHSTYQKEYLKVAPFAALTLESISKTNPLDFTLRPVPYTGNVYVSIPEYPAIGHQMGLEVAKVLKGNITVKQALQNGQRLVKNQMIKSGYIK